MKNGSFIYRLGFALTGLRQAWQREKSFRSHVICAAGVFIFLLVLKPGFLWSALVILVASLVIGVELINSAIECLADHLHPDRHPEIKAVKDLGAAAVLVFAVASLAVAALMILSIVSGQGFA
jgi:diacylglycerol kinase